MVESFDRRLIRRWVAGWVEVGVNFRMAPDPSWTVVRTGGLAGPFHAADPLPRSSTGDDADIPHQLWVHRVSGPALVLGSTQPDELIDRRNAMADGVEVCRRRSGGGLVFVDPATDCWIDVIVPRRSPRWDDDVGRAAHWVGELWADVLGGLPRLEADVAPPVVHRRPDRSRQGGIWCFGGLGHGEVTMGDAKVVGVAQRRTRHWARIQTVVAGRWPIDRLRRYVATAVVDGDSVAADPSAIVAGLPTGLAPVDPSDLAERFIARLGRDFSSI